MMRQPLTFRNQIHDLSTVRTQGYRQKVSLFSFPQKKLSKGKHKISISPVFVTYYILGMEEGERDDARLLECKKQGKRSKRG